MCTAEVSGEKRVSDEANQTGPGRTSSASADAAMGRYAQGEQAAFGEVYDCVGPRLYSFLLRKTGGNTALAEDLTQQTFLQMHRARGRYIKGASVMSWACAIAHRLLIDTLRKDSRKIQHADTLKKSAEKGHAPDSEQVLQARQTQRAIEAALAGLPASQREAFELIKWHGMTQVEAAETLGVTLPAIKALTHRAYKAVRAALDGEHTSQ